MPNSISPLELYTRPANPNLAELDNLRLPPNSIESESSVIGGLLLDNDAWDRVSDLISESDFYHKTHQLIFNAIVSLLSVGKAADVITVFEQLRLLRQETEVGGLEYLNTLAQYVNNAVNIRRYAEVIREKAILRKLISAADTIATGALNAKGRKVTDILDEAENNILRIGEENSRLKEGFTPISQLLTTLVDKVEEMKQNENPSDLIGVPSGFSDLDRRTAGLQGGDLIILAARPSMGKTSLALNIAENVALIGEMPVAIFSMEMGADQLTLRIVGSVARINQTNLRTGKLSDDEQDKFTEGLEKLSQTQMFIDETPGLSIAELRAKARRLERKCGKLGLIVIDYIQLMSGTSNSSDNRSTELGEISRGLKMLAKELSCPVLALSQLNRGVESRSDKRPLMSDLRESGAIEQDADIIMFIYRDDYYNEKSSKPDTAEIIIAKHRNGPTGKIDLYFAKSQTRFENLATESYADY